jgi:hypothetical protein
MARGYSTARSEQSDAMRKEAGRLIDAAAKIEAKERADAEAKKVAEAKAKAEATVASGKIPTKQELEAQGKALNDFYNNNRSEINRGMTGQGGSYEREIYAQYKALNQKSYEMQEAAKAPEKLKELKDAAERDKAEKKAIKITKKGNDAGDKTTNEGPKAQKIALKVEKIATKASSAADKYFGAKDKKGVNAQKNKEKMKELVAKQAAAIPLEVRIAIQQLSRHNLGQDLVSAGVNALKYNKSKGKVSGGEDYERGRDGDGAFTYDSWGDLRYEAKRGGTERKSGSVTHKGVTYKWESEDSSNKIGWDPKQFAIHGKVTIKANNKTIFEGEEIGIEGG